MKESEMEQARKHHGDNIAYELLLNAIRNVESKAYYMYEGEMTEAQICRAIKMAQRTIRQVAKPVIKRLSSAGYDFGPPYDLFEDCSSSLDKVA